MTLESNLVKKYQDSASDVLVQDVMKAPNMFVAAAMMRQNKMFYGRGDFKKAVMTLGEEANPAFKDVGSKLAMLKTGYLFHKKGMIDLNDENAENGIQMIKEKQAADIPEMAALPVFADKNAYKRVFDHGINYKQVFQVWAK